METMSPWRCLCLAWKVIHCLSALFQVWTVPLGMSFLHNCYFFFHLKILRTAIAVEMLRIFKALCRKRGLPGGRFIWDALLCPPVVICCQCGNSRSTRCLSIPSVSSKASPPEGNFPAIHWSSGAQLWLLSSLVDVRHSVDVRTWENRPPTVEKSFHCLACEMTAVLSVKNDRRTPISLLGREGPF